MYLDHLNINYFKFKKHKFNSIELDAITSQEIVLSNTISSHPIETGEILPDAITNNPEEITFSAVISDLSQDYKQEVSRIKNIAQAVFTDKKLRSSKSVRAWYELHKLWKSKTVVYITSPIQIEPFSDMVIKELRVTLDSSKALKFTVTLEKFRILDRLKKKNFAPEVGKQSSRKR